MENFSYFNGLRKTPGLFRMKPFKEEKKDFVLITLSFDQARK